MAMARAEPLDARSRKTALIVSTVALAACFMIWTVFSITGVRIQRDFGLNSTQFGLLVGMPVLNGALSRLLLGILAERVGRCIASPAVQLLADETSRRTARATRYASHLAAALGR